VLSTNEAGYPLHRGESSKDRGEVGKTKLHVEEDVTDHAILGATHHEGGARGQKTRDRQPNNDRGQGITQER